MSKSKDLHALADLAHNQIELDRQRYEANLQRVVVPRLWPKVMFAIVLAISFLVLLDKRTLLFWFGISDQTQLTEMTSALNAAKVAVEQAHGSTGEWPDRVPLPALASLVELQNPGPQYRLRTNTSRWQLTMTPSGEVERVKP
jgi:hypothetical protein